MEIDLERFRTVCDDHNIRWIVDYSGRGMYGLRCVGIIGRARDFARFMLAVVPLIDEDYHAERGGDEDNMVTNIECSDEWFDAAQDNMDTEMIYYWPRIQAVKNTEEKDEDPNAGDARDADSERMP